MKYAGYWIFDELPDKWFLTGWLLIAGSGIYVLHLQTRRQRMED